MKNHKWLCSHSLNVTIAIAQSFPNFFVGGMLQGYFKWTRNPCQNCQVSINAFSALYYLLVKLQSTTVTA